VKTDVQPICISIIIWSSNIRGINLCYFLKSTLHWTIIVQSLKILITVIIIIITMRPKLFVLCSRCKIIIYYLLVFINVNRDIIKFLNSHNGGWSPNWAHSAHRPLLAYCTCPGWLWGWRIWWNEDRQGWKPAPKRNMSWRTAFLPCLLFSEMQQHIRQA
jgi:hypothetical protein